MKDKLAGTLTDNLGRVESLVLTYESHPGAQGKGRKGVEVLDILRAAVVLLHASLEDLLRGVAGWKLPQAPKEVLDDIPLVGTGPTPKRFLLGELAQYRGTSVDNLISASVENHLLRSNYNNPREIAALLEGIGVNPSKVSGQFPNLGAMMERRHQIVHRADRQSAVAGSGDHVVRAINKTTVRGWAGDVDTFASALLSEL